MIDLFIDEDEMGSTLHATEIQAHRPVDLAGGCVTVKKEKVKRCTGCNTKLSTNRTRRNSICNACEDRTRP